MKQPWWMEATFTGLDPAKEYEFVTSANRGSSSNTDRFSKFTISGVDSCIQASTPGVTVHSNESVTICTGYNTVNGYVARWSNIKCGADGTFTVRVEDGGGAQKGYGFDGIMLREVDLEPLQPGPPGVAITSPINGATVKADFTIEAMAIDDGEIINVEFYANDVFLGESSSEPYTWDWIGAPVGPHALKAVAHDNDGLCATSAVTYVTVSDAPVVGFTAYNDCSQSSGTPANTTEYRGNGTTSGYLKDFDTGETLPVRLTITASQVAYGGAGGPMPNPGTDAHDVFDGKVVFDNIIWYNHVTTWWMEATFTGLDPEKDYEFVTSANRGSSSNTDRFSKFTISGADHCVQASTPGVIVHNNESVTICTGYNTVNGYVARWTNIRCGPDGTFKVRVEDGGGAQKGYAFDGIMLRETEPAPLPPGPPSVAITNPQDGASVKADFTIEAWAMDDGFVTHVDFYGDGVLLGSSDTPPYSCEWTGTSPGSHSIFAVATDNEGLVATSAVVTVISSGTTSFTAYNDCSTRTGILPNTTEYRTNGTTSGFLKDFDTGETLPVSITLAAQNVAYNIAGGVMTPGTDCHDVFDGKVVFDSCIAYESVTKTWWMTATFAGLDPSKEYEFVTSANRNGSTYSGRFTKFTISGIESCVQASTPGVDVLSNESVRFCTGYNTVNGYVARWTNIRPAADGTFTVRAEDGNGAEPGRSYAFDGIMLRESSAQQEPLILTDIVMDNGSIELSWSGASGSVRIEETPSLKNPSWTTVEGATDLQENVYRIDIDNDSPQRFYRLIVE